MTILFCYSVKKKPKKKFVCMIHCTLRQVCSEFIVSYKITVRVGNFNLGFLQMIKYLKQRR